MPLSDNIKKAVQRAIEQAQTAAAERGPVPGLPPGVGGQIGQQLPPIVLPGGGVRGVSLPPGVAGPIGPGGAPAIPPPPPRTVPTMDQIVEARRQQAQTEEAAINLGVPSPPPPPILRTVEQEQDTLSRSIRRAKESEFFFAPETLPARTEGLRTLGVEAQAAFDQVMEANDLILGRDPHPEDPENIFTLLNKAEDQVTERDRERLQAVFAPSQNAEGEWVPAAVVQQALRVIEENVGLVSQYPEELRRVAMTTITNALDTAFQQARQDNKISLDAFVISPGVRAVERIISDLAQGLDPGRAVIRTDEGVQSIEVLTGNGVDKILSGLAHALLQATMQEVKEDAANVFLSRAVGFLSRTSTLEDIGDTRDATALVRWFSEDTGTGYPISGIDALVALRDNPVYQGHKDLLTLYADREQLGLTFDGVYAAHEGALRPGMPTPSTFRDMWGLAEVFDAAEQYARTNGVPVERVLRWSQWALDNHVGPTEVANLDDILGRNGMLRGGPSVLAQVYRVGLEYTKIIEAFAVKNLAWLEDHTDVLGVGLPAAAMTVAPLFGGPILAPVFLAGNLIAGAKSAVGNLLQGDIMGALDEGSEPFRLLPSASHDYLLAMNALSEDDVRYAVNHGFGALWSGLASAREVQHVADQLRSGQPIEEVVKNNADLLNFIAVLGGEVLFDPWNAAGGLGLYFRGASWGARAIRLPIPRVAQVLGLGERAAFAVSRTEPTTIAMRTLWRFMLKPTSIKIAEHTLPLAVKIAEHTLPLAVHIHRDVQTASVASRAAIRLLTRNVLEVVPGTDMLVRPIKMIEEVSGSVRNIASEPFQNLLERGNTYLTESNVALAITKRFLAKRITHMVDQQFNRLFNMAAMDEAGARALGMAGRTFRGLVEELDGAWKSLTGTEHVLDAAGLQKAWADPAQRRAAANFMGRTFNRGNLDEVTFYFANATRDTTLHNLRGVQQVYKFLDNIPTHLSPEELVRQYEDLRRVAYREILESVEDGAIRLMGVESVPLAERALSLIGAPLSVLYLMSPRFIIRNTVGGALLTVIYGQNKLFGRYGLAMLGVTKRAAEAAKRAGVRPESFGGLDAIGMLGKERAAASSRSFLSAIRERASIRYWDRRRDRELRMITWASQYTRIMDGWTDALLEGAGDSPGLRQAIEGLVGEGSPLANSVVGALEPSADLAATHAMFARLIRNIESDKNLLVPDLTTLAGRKLGADLMQSEWASELTGRIWDLEDLSEAGVRSVLMENDGAILREVGERAEFHGFHDLAVNPVDLVNDLANDYYRSLGSLRDIPAAISKTEKDMWVRQANLNLAYKYMDWGLQTQENELIRAVTGVGSLVHGTAYERPFAQAVEAFQALRAPGHEFDHLFYGIPGDVGEPGKWVPFKFVPEGQAARLSDGTLIPEEWVTRNADEATYLTWIRDERTIPGTHNIHGGGQTKVGEERAWANYKTLLDNAYEFADNGRPVPYGWNYEITLLTRARTMEGTISPRTWSEAYSNFKNHANRRFAAVNSAFDDLVIAPLRQVMKDAGVNDLWLPPLRGSTGAGIGQVPSRFVWERYAPALPDMPTTPVARLNVAQHTAASARIAGMQARFDAANMTIDNAKRLRNMIERGATEGKEAQKVAHRIRTFMQRVNASTSEDDLLRNQLVLQMMARDGLDESVVNMAADEMMLLTRRLATVREMMDNITPRPGRKTPLEELDEWRGTLGEPGPTMVDEGAIDLQNILRGGTSTDRRLFSVPGVSEANLRNAVTDATGRRIVRIAQDNGLVLTNNDRIASRMAQRGAPTKALDPRTERIVRPLKNLADELNAIDVSGAAFEEVETGARFRPSSVTRRGPSAPAARPTPSAPQLEPFPSVAETVRVRAAAHTELIEKTQALLDEMPAPLQPYRDHILRQYQAITGETTLPAITNIGRATQFREAVNDILGLVSEVTDAQELRRILAEISVPTPARINPVSVRLNNPMRGNAPVAPDFTEGLRSWFTSTNHLSRPVERILRQADEGRYVAKQDLVAALIDASDAATVREALRFFGHDGIAFVAKGPLNELVDMLAVFDRSALTARVGTEAAVGPIPRQLTPRMVNGITTELLNYERLYDQVQQAAVSSASAITDWATHNAFSANDFDFLSRFMFPWEWWMTRTLGKGALRLSENPRVIAGYVRMQEDLDEINADLPAHIRNRLQISVPGWPSALGKGPIFDPLSIIFAFDIDPYIPFDASPSMRWLQHMQSAGLAINPVLTTALSSAGALGKNARETPFSGTPLEQWYNASVRAMHLLGWKDLPLQIRFTRQDAFIIERNIARIVTESPDKYSVAQIMEAFAILDESVPAGLVGALFNSSLQRSDNPVLQEGLQWYLRERALTSDVSFFTGFLTAARSPLDKAWFDKADELSGLLRDALLKSVGLTGLDGDGGAAVRAFFEAHPEADLYLSRGDSAAEIRLQRAKTEYFNFQEAYFAPFQARLDALPLQGFAPNGTPVDVERRRILDEMFNDTKLDEARTQWLAQTGLAIEEVVRDTAFRSTPHSRDIFLAYQVLMRTATFAERQRFVDALSEDDRALLEKELDNKTTSIGEYLVAGLKSLDANDLASWRDNNGVVEWDRRAQTREATLSVLPPEIRLQVERAEVQFKPPRELVRQIVEDYYTTAWLEYIRLGLGTDHENRNRLQAQFRDDFKPPRRADIINAVQRLRPDMTGTEIAASFDVSEFTDFSLFVALQNGKKIATLEVLGEPFYAPSGELVNQATLTDYKDATVALEDWIGAREADAPIDWSLDMEFWFGGGEEGKDALRNLRTRREDYGSLIEWAIGKTGDWDELVIGSFARTIHGLRPEMTVSQGLEALSLDVDRLGLVYSAIKEPFKFAAGENVPPEQLDQMVRSIQAGEQVPGSAWRRVDGSAQTLTAAVGEGPAARVARDAEREATRLATGGTGRRGIAGTATEELTKTDILRLLQNRKISGDEAFERLMRLGYTQQDAELLVHDAMDNLRDRKPTNPFAPREVNAATLRARARELLGSDRVLDEISEVSLFGRTLSKVGERDLRLLYKLFRIPGATTFEEWLSLVKTLLAAERRGVSIPGRGPSFGLGSREIRRVRRFV